MSVYPPDWRDFVAQLRKEADDLDEVAPRQPTMGAVWQARREAVDRRQYADRLERHMRGEA